MLKPKRQLKTYGKSEKQDKIAELISELFSGMVKMHMQHLKTESFAAHKALDEFYTEIQDMVDSVAEQYQGACEMLINWKTVPVEPLSTTNEALEYLRSLYEKITVAQQDCMYTEIGNELDNIKSLISSTKYKLLFLK